MSRGVARLGDKTLGSCSVHGNNIMGTIITASTTTTTANGLPVARLTDMVLAECGHESKIITASPTVTDGKLGVARLNDKVGASPYEARIISASSNTFA
jgi:hypothetical protein